MTSNVVLALLVSIFVFVSWDSHWLWSFLPFVLWLFFSFFDVLVEVF